MKAGDFKIGIVDDHIQTAISISQLLETNGFKTFQTYNVHDTIERVPSEKPDLLLLDMKLNDGSGYDVATKLSKQKIVFISGYDMDVKKIKTFKNVIGTLIKPIDNELLLKMVRKELKLPEPKKL